MHPDSWEHMSERERKLWLQESKKKPCRRCAHNHGGTTCSMGFDLDGEHPGCIVRKQWWTPREKQ